MLGQRRGGELVLDAQRGAHLPPVLADAFAGSAGHLRVHRGLLQPPAAAQLARQSHPGRVREAQDELGAQGNSSGIINLSVETGQSHLPVLAGWLGCCSGWLAGSRLLVLVGWLFSSRLAGWLGGSVPLAYGSAGLSFLSPPVRGRRKRDGRNRYRERTATRASQPGVVGEPASQRGALPLFSTWRVALRLLRFLHLFRL